MPPLKINPLRIRLKPWQKAERQWIKDMIDIVKPHNIYELAESTGWKPLTLLTKLLQYGLERKAKR